jgi:chromosome segregation ATPase
MVTIVQERVGVLETKVATLNEKLDDLKTDVKEVHEVLDRNKDEIKDQLKTMYDASCSQHAALNTKIEAIEKVKDKWTYIAMGAIGVIGFLSGHMDKVMKFFA